ncbi:MAG: SPOR domain-containing protein [Bacteroidetes bacterium]|nr:SPOR domain-containing protein [Rhodothermia bacterium]MCS7155119.1 SPOR domain-containing protein [Bacteroidota bacterium]MCX7906244.1 SPOR domain-containing protein [Bacteroidota bacterium]MDW8138772.1 SPOR domain-containing protein [Bacteroidota bacterium]MDW8286425.1 SPOR domain-containing protein [Bacteroidota bacterium]
MKPLTSLLVLLVGTSPQDPLATWIERALKPGADRAALRAELERLRVRGLDPAGLLFAEGLWWEPERPAEAARLYEQVLIRYGRSPYAAHAQDRLVAYYAAQGRLDEVDRIARLRSGGALAPPQPNASTGFRSQAASAPAAWYTVQAALLRDRAQAEQLVRRLRNLGFTVQLVESSSNPDRLYKVWVGRFPDRASAEQKFAMIRNAVRAIQSDLRFSGEPEIVPIR